MSGRKVKTDGRIQLAGGRRSLIAAYREGLGLAAIVVLCGESGIRIAAQRPEESACAAKVTGNFYCWCRRFGEAERIAATALARLRYNGDCHMDAGLLRAQKAVAAAARRLGVTILTDDDIAAEAAVLIARVDQEIARLQRSGELKSVNQAYRAYRMEAGARGERITRYADWLENYKQTAVRELAAALRFA